MAQAIGQANGLAQAVGLAAPAGQTGRPWLTRPAGPAGPAGWPARPAQPHFLQVKVNHPLGINKITTYFSNSRGRVRVF